MKIYNGYNDRNENYHPIEYFEMDHSIRKTIEYLEFALDELKKDPHANLSPCSFLFEMPYHLNPDDWLNNRKSIWKINEEALRMSICSFKAEIDPFSGLRISVSIDSAASYVMIKNNKSHRSYNKETHWKVLVNTISSLRPHYAVVQTNFDGYEDEVYSSLFNYPRRYFGNYIFIGNRMLPIISIDKFRKSFFHIQEWKSLGILFYSKERDRFRDNAKKRKNRKLRKQGKSKGKINTDKVRFYPHISDRENVFVDFRDEIRRIKPG